ncbi:sodium-translocating pyrophosphatase [Propioniciclava tarda]|uniref:K(+)-insensitive pyrophosphate-energized proton pump n=1 Tax=Propioniciclava tarda TaxID=433330 RepID=A0A4Q9KLA5_PROTD|nr:sodium-translocating pyrophosphatase [Propioniciclava tarda]TBT95292.1 sodium-translocating pyrophosphatase [Propioniciclava tarda]SMO60274.1 K(+)-stimulated pyrophosphate-energized sodium pump [Propioniciclava tarda]
MVSFGNTSITIVAVIGIMALVALVVAWFLRGWVLRQHEGTPGMQAIAAAVQEGAQAYLNRQMRTLSVFAVLVFALLFALPGELAVRIGRSVAFLGGALFSAATGYLGMWLAVRANVRVAAAAGSSDGKADGARIAFRTGGVVGMAVVGLGLLGAALALLTFRDKAPAVLEGFGFGAALLAMFMRVGGGIFTKAADVGADLVGKVEVGIPEDDPRNAATIADNVGDNVGDCAGMAADLFESYAVTLVASLILGKAALGEQGLVFPILIAAVGVVVALIGIAATRIKRDEPGLRGINRGFYLSAGIGIVLSAVASYVYLPATFAGLSGLASEVSRQPGDPRLILAAAVVIGVVLAGGILWLTGYYTGTESGPTMRVAASTRTGAATVILSGFGLGLESAAFTAGAIAVAISLCFVLAGGSLWLALFLIAVAGCGVLTTVGVIVAMDTFGPISDNAQGIAEMSGEVHLDAALVLTDLDAVGNTTKAITKGIAIATAVLAATALFGAYNDAVAGGRATLGEGTISDAFVKAMADYSIVAPMTLIGVVLGAATVFLFANLCIDSVTRTASTIVFEVRRQFREIPGIMTGEGRPEYGRVVDICTKASLRELVTPGLLAVTAPMAVGFGLGVGPLAGFLAGSIAAGVLMAVLLSNSGGAWDNAKKIVEDGNYGGKNSKAHEASVIGDTVGDPFKDTAGPAINPLIKVMNLVSVLVAPTAIILSEAPGASQPLRIAIACVAAAIAFGAITNARLRANRAIASADDEVPAR